MPNKFKNILLMGAALSMIAPTAANAQTNGSDNTFNDDVIVTAQRRAQSILDVPVAVTALNQEFLEDQGINNMLDLKELSPSVSGVTIANPMATDIRIRGLGTTGSNAGFESSVGMYVDDIYYSRPGLALISFFDMESVEVYRGPQGTLFGKNIAAGAISQKTQAPEIGDEFSGYVSAEYAEFNSLDLRGAVNFGVGENSAIRFAGVIDNTDGYMTNITTDDDAAAFTDIWGVRAQFLTEPSDGLSIRLTADVNTYESGRHYQQNNALGPDGNPITVGGVQLSRFDNNTSYPSNAVTEQFGLAAHIEYDINDTVALKSISSYRDADTENLDGDFDFSAAPIASDLDETQDHKTLSQEFLLTFDTDRAFITTGIHYFDEEIDFMRFNVSLGAPFGGGTFQNVAYLQNEDSLGIFGHVDFELTDQFSIIGGLRYSKVNKDVDFRNLLGAPSVVHDNIANDPSLNAFFGGGGGADSAFPWADDRSFDGVSGDIALQWRPTDRIQAYAKYSRGFKAGGFNLNEAAAGGRPLTQAADLAAARAISAGAFEEDGRFYAEFDPDRASYESEEVDSFEVSVRYNLDNGLISATAFASEISNAQVGVFTGLGFETFTADNATSNGIELEAQFDLTDYFSVNGALTLLDTEYGEELVRPEIVRGREFPFAPSTAFTVGANYNQPLSDSMALNAAVNVSYHSDEFSRIQGCTDADGNSSVFQNCVEPANLFDVADPDRGNANTFFQNEGHALVSANLGLTLNDRYKVEVFCTNCTDEYHTNYSTFTPIANQRGDNPGAPQTFGARVRADF